MSLFGVVAMASCSRRAPPPPIASSAPAHSDALPARFMAPARAELMAVDTLERIFKP
jgi:hypothetical protein